MTSKTFQAAVFRPDVDAAQMETVSLNELRVDEVLVKLVASGICHTDLTCRNGFMPMPRPIVLGHEGSGIVESVGSAVKSIKPGDKVVMSFLPCGTCAKCQAGSPAQCHNFAPHNLSGRRADGSTAISSGNGEVGGHFFGQSSFSTYSVANERNVVKVRADAPLELLGPLGCGVQTGAGSVMNVLQPKAGDSIVVFGAGGVGLSAVMAAVVEGCKPIIVVEPNAARRTLALELGAHHALDPNDGSDTLKKLQQLSAGGLNHALDTSGHIPVFSTALAALGPGGKFAFVSAQKLDAMMPPMAVLDLVGRSITLRGVNMGDSVPKTFIPKLVDLIMAGKFPVQKLVQYYDFKDINKALDDQEHGRTVKPIVRMN